MRRLAIVVLALLVALFVALAGCRSRASSPRRDAVFGDLSAARGEPSLATDEVAAYLAVARAELGSRTIPAVPSVRAGRRVFLSVFGVAPRPLVGSGLGATLRDSVVAAADALRALAPDSARAQRLALDVVTTRARDDRPHGAELGRFGYAESDGERFGFVLPGELVWRGLLADDELTLDERSLGALVDERFGASPSHARRHRFETTSFAQLEARAPPIRLQRGMPMKTSADRVDSDAMDASARSAADHLSRACGDDGRFDYLYDAVRDLRSDDYNIIRHCGAAESLLEAYGAFGDPAHLSAASRALEFLKPKLLTDATDPIDATDQKAMHLENGKNALGPIGGTGLALIAFAKRAEVTHDLRDLEAMRAMARFLVRQLQPNGEFAPYWPDAKDAWEVLYFPGEAMLGLMRLHALDPDARWLSAVVRAAERRLAVPPASAYDRDHDYWFILTLDELHRVTGDRRWLEHAMRLVRAVVDGQREDDARAAEHPSTSFFDDDRVAPAGSRLEAIAAAIALARRGGVDDGALVECASSLARFVLAQQYDQASSFALPNPDRARGGFHGAPWSGEVRIDYDQHALVGLLGFTRALGQPHAPP